MPYAEIAKHGPMVSMIALPREQGEFGETRLARLVEPRAKVTASTPRESAGRLPETDETGWPAGMVAEPACSADERDQTIARSKNIESSGEGSSATRFGVRQVCSFSQTGLSHRLLVPLNRSKQIEKAPTGWVGALL